MHKVLPSRIVLYFLRHFYSLCHYMIHILMAKDPPPFAQSAYWDDRFTKNPSAFDWLLPANCLDGPIIEALEHHQHHQERPSPEQTSSPPPSFFPSCSSTPCPRPRVLHIGCGTSVLSLHLRSHVRDPRQVHNTDFSRVAIELGARWEREVFEADAAAREAGERVVDGKGKAPRQDAAPPRPRSPPRPLDVRSDDPPRMRWSTLDLLALAEVVRLAEEGVEGGSGYEIVVDKSTCDAISCGDDVAVRLPHPLLPDDMAPRVGKEEAVVNVHPLHVLALHLAALVPAGGRWIALSYSGQRFPFLEPFPARVEEGRLDEDVLAKGFVHPGRLWRLMRKETVELEGEDGGGGEGRGIVHRPRTAHWVYVMVRTDVALVIRR